MPRVAFIDYFPTHYRRRLYEEIARRADADFFFFSDERERWWNRNLDLARKGDFRPVELPRHRIAGEPVMWGIVPLILSGRYDAVVKNTNGRIMLPLVYSATKARGAVFVLWTGMWMHPRSAFHRISKPFTESIYRGSDAIVTYGEHVRQFVLQTRGVRPEKVFVAGQAVDSTGFVAVEPVRNGTRPVVVYVGQFEERKGLPYLLDAFDHLSGSHATLRIIGSGSQEAWLRSRIGRRDDIELLGHRTQEQLPGELSSARCLVLPSTTTAVDKEPWGLVVNEAFHAGIPVVVSDAVGAAAGGLVKDGRNGFVVPERDSVALARALRRIVEEPDLAARMGDAGRHDVEAFNYGRMAQAFLGAVEYGMSARRSAQ